MEVVKAFNSELSSLYEGKPPISKAKMTAITKSAIKGIKFYKHIVQSVEKFVQKCRPEYKVPGLYVVDSIVRQSRHQFGQDKDVFAPRFTKNIQNTFQHLFKCPVEDRPKIVRVLNLWQKNQVFPPDVIQPLLDMASPGAAPGDSSQQGSDMLIDVKASKNSLDNWKGWNHGNSMQEPLPGTVQETKTYALTQENLNSLAAEAENAHPPDPDLLVKLQSLASQLLTNRTGGSSAVEEKVPGQPAAPAVKFNKKLLDFDYGDDEEEEEEESFEDPKPPSFVEPALEDSGGQTSEPNAIALSMAQNLLNNPELLKQLQQMQQTLQQQSTEALQAEASTPPPAPSSAAPAEPAPAPSQFAADPALASPSRPPPQQPPQQGTTPQQTAAQLANAPAVVTPGFMGMPGMPPPAVVPQGFPDAGQPHVVGLYPPPPMGMAPMGMPFGGGEPPGGGFLPLAIPVSSADEQLQQQQQQPPAPPMPEGGPTPVLPSYMSGGDLDERSGAVLGPGGRDMDLRTPAGGASSPGRDRDRRRDRSRSPRRRGRSRSRSPSSRASGNRYGSTAKRDRSRERESRENTREKERERERERRRKGFPPVKKNCLSVCSATLWLGHVPKSVSEMDLHDTFGEFGTIVRIDMIPPRGCAYVCMDRRQDAFRALQKLKNLKLQGSLIKMAWAPGKGVKGKELKDYWEVDLGVSYIPLDKLPANVDLSALEEGGVLDQDSLPDSLKGNPLLALKSSRGLGDRQEKHAEQERQRAMGGAGDPAANQALIDLAQQQQQPQQVSAEALMAVAFPPVAAAPVVTTMATPGGTAAVAMVPPPVPQFGIPLPPGMLPSQGLVMPQMQLPMGVPPPPNHMLMVPPNSSQTLLGPSALGLLPPHLGLPGAALGLPLHPPMSIPVTSQAPVMPVVTMAGSAATSAGQPAPTVPAPAAEGQGTDVVPMAIDGDATPTDEDGTSEASRMGLVPPPATSEASAASHKESVSNTKPGGSEFGGVPPGGFGPLAAPPGVPSQFVTQGLCVKEKAEAEAATKPSKSPTAGSSHEAPSADAKAKQSDTAEPDKMQVDKPGSSGPQAPEARQEGLAFEAPPAAIPMPVGMPGMPSPPMPPRGFGGPPVRFAGPPMFPFEGAPDGRPNMEFPGPRLMGPDPRMLGPPSGDFRPPVPHDQGVMAGPGEQRMMGVPLEPRMLDGHPEARMMGGPMEPRMHGGPEPRMMGGLPEPRMMGGPLEARMMGGPPEPRMMGGPEELRMLGGPPEHRMMGGPRDHRMMGVPMPEPRMMGGPPDRRMMGGPMDHRMMGGPMEHRMLGGPPDHRMMGGPPDHRMMGGPPNHRMMGGPPDHRMMGGPPDHRMMGGPPDHRMMGGPPDHRMMGGPPDHRMMGGPPDHRMLPGPPDHRMLGPPDFRLGGPPPDLRTLGPPEPRMLAPGPNLLAPNMPPMMGPVGADLKPQLANADALKEGKQREQNEEGKGAGSDDKREENGKAGKPPAGGPDQICGKANGPEGDEKQGFGFFGPPRSRFSDQTSQPDRGPDGPWGGGSRDSDEAGFGGDRRVFTNAFGEVQERRRGSGRERRSRWSRDNDEHESRSRSERSDRDRSDRDRSERDRSDRDRNDRERSERDRSDRDRSDRDRSDRDRSDRDRIDRDRSDRDRSDRDRKDRERSRDRTERDRDRDRERSDRDRDRGDKDRSDRDRGDREKDRDRSDRDRNDKDRDRSDRDRDKDREKDRDRSDRDRDRGDRDRDRGDKDRSERSERSSSRGDHRRSRDRERSAGRSHGSPERLPSAAAAPTAETNGELSNSSNSGKPNGSTAEVPLLKDIESKAADAEVPKEAAEQTGPEVKT
ncbi:insulator su(Hw) mRNA adaptor isoform X3 [Haemaphysalis longicornis]